MSAQTRYGFSTPIGSAGGIIDLAPYAIDTFLNEEETGDLKPGMGVVQGSNPGANIALPTEGATADQFEGVTTNNRTTEFDMEGKIQVRNGVAVGVMRYGRIYVRLASDAEPSYGDPLHLVTKGDDAGCFTESEDGVAVSGRFLGAGENGIAPAELFNAPAPAKGD